MTAKRISCSSVLKVICVTFCLGDYVTLWTPSMFMLTKFKLITHHRTRIWISCKNIKPFMWWMSFATWMIPCNLVVVVRVLLSIDAKLPWVNIGLCLARLNPCWTWLVCFTLFNYILTIPTRYFRSIVLVLIVA